MTSLYYGIKSLVHKNLKHAPLEKPWSMSAFKSLSTKINVKSFDFDFVS